MTNSRLEESVVTFTVGCSSAGRTGRLVIQRSLVQIPAPRLGCMLKCLWARYIAHQSATCDELATWEYPALALRQSWDWLQQQHPVTPWKWISGYGQWHDVTFTVGECKTDQDNKNVFWKNIFYSVPDAMIGVLQKQLFKPNCIMMRGAQALHPRARFTPCSVCRDLKVNRKWSEAWAAPSQNDFGEEKGKQIGVRCVLGAFQWGVP